MTSDEMQKIKDILTETFKDVEQQIFFGLKNHAHSYRPQLLAELDVLTKVTERINGRVFNE